MTAEASLTATPTGARGVRRARLPWWVRYARIVALAVVIGIGINHVWWSVSDWHLNDMSAYWEAGLRIRGGEPLYPEIANIEASEVYRYSPWFAWLWAPITYLPRMLVGIGWSAALLACSALAIRPLVERRAWFAVAFFLPILIGISATGNAHALVIGMLVWGVERRSGPLWIGAAASLKIVPLALVITYLGRRQWKRAAATIIITGLLAAPALLYDLSAYVTDAGDAALLWRWPAIYAVAVGGLAIASLIWARSRFAWLASSLTATLAIPRFFLYDVTFLMVAVPSTPPRPDPDGVSPRREAA